MNGFALKLVFDIQFIHGQAIGQSMKALKILVISMGLLIVIGLGLVGYALTRKAPRPGAVATPGTTEVVLPSAMPFAFQYPVPKGSKLEQVLTTGDRVVLRYSSP